VSLASELIDDWMIDDWRLQSQSSIAFLLLSDDERASYRKHISLK
jgi:hypothetical protein